jgi:hypothetical protein
MEDALKKISSDVEAELHAWLVKPEPQRNRHVAAQYAFRAEPDAERLREA